VYKKLTTRARAEEIRDIEHNIIMIDSILLQRCIYFLFCVMGMLYFVLKKYKTTNTNQMKSNRPFFGLFESPAMVNYTDLVFFFVLAKIPKYSSLIR
jgi:hypothetical protein